MYFNINASPRKRLDVAASNFAAAHNLEGTGQLFMWSRSEVK